MEDRENPVLKIEHLKMCIRDRGRLIYFYFNPERFWKYIRPVRKQD